MKYIVVLEEEVSYNEEQNLYRFLQNLGYKFEVVEFIKHPRKVAEAAEAHEYGQGESWD